MSNLIIWIVFQGTGDFAYKNGNLLPENIMAVAKEVGFPLVLRNHEGYDHGYYFISTFVEDHIKHHMRYLRD